MDLDIGIHIMAVGTVGAVPAGKQVDVPFTVNMDIIANIYSVV